MILLTKFTLLTIGKKSKLMKSLILSSKKVIKGMLNGQNKRESIDAEVMIDFSIR